ncbi:hypothetical protein [Rubellimicrobium mesophilum]|nr:hypothetical protein [Rubellimicrobium mesophilum]
METNGPLLGVMNLRQLATFRPEGCCVGLLDDLRRIHNAARQLFHGVLGQRFIDPATLEKMLWSLDRQIEAGQDLQPQLVHCGASEETQAELADLIAYFQAVRRTVEGRLGAPVARRL